MRIFRAFENSGRFLDKKMAAKGEGVLCALFFRLRCIDSKMMHKILQLRERADRSGVMLKIVFPCDGYEQRK